MFTVKLLGGAKKSLAIDTLEIQEDAITISQLLDFLQQRIPKGQQPLDTNNLMIAINGVDSSALKGFSSVIQTDDVVTIIPIIHGGSKGVIRFSILNRTVGIIEIKKPRIDVAKFLTNLRQNHPDLTIQAISSNYILNAEHVKKVITISLTAKENNIMLSNNIETDILMRFAGTTQIHQAIQKAGIQQKKSFAIVGIGKIAALDELFLELKSVLNPHPLSKNNSSFLKKEFAITTKQLKSVLSKTPLEDLLAEKAALLFR